MKFNNHISGITPTFTGSATAGWFLVPTGSTQASDENFNTALSVGSLWASEVVGGAPPKSSGGIIFDLKNDAIHYRGGARYNFSTQGDSLNYKLLVLASGAYDSGWVNLLTQTHSANLVGSITRIFDCGSNSNFRYLQFMTEVETGAARTGSMSFTLVDAWLV